MKDRIEINGVWYVREDKPKPEYNFRITDTESMILETSTSCFEMTVLKDYNYDPSIQYTDKTVGEFGAWKNEFWDSEAWMKGVLENNPESLQELPNLTDEDLAALQYLIKEAVERGWLE